MNTHQVRFVSRAITVSMTMNVRWVLASVAGAAILAGGLIVLDQTIGSNLFKLGGWGQPKMQTAPTESGVPQAQVRVAAPTAPAAPSAPQRTEPTQRSESIMYDSWTVTCRDMAEETSKKICSGTLNLIEQKQGRILLTWMVGRDNQGVLRTVMQTPTGVQIPKGVELKLGNGPVRTLPFTACGPQQCEASMALDDAMVRDAMASSEVVITIFAVDGRGVNFNVPIKGIDKVFAAMGK